MLIFVQFANFQKHICMLKYYYIALQKIYIFTEKIAMKKTTKRTLAIFALTIFL